MTININPKHQNSSWSIDLLQPELQFQNDWIIIIIVIMLIVIVIITIEDLSRYKEFFCGTFSIKQNDI